MLPNSLNLGISYDLFWHLSPKEIQCFTKAYNERRKREDQDMLMLSHYLYEATYIAIANSFGGSRIPLREKTYTQEYEESQRTSEELALANGMEIMKNLELSMKVFNATHRDKQK